MIRLPGATRSPGLSTVAAAPAVAGVLAVALISAAAASLGGLTSAALDAWSSAAATGAPSVVAWENFDGTNGTNLNGTTTDGGSRTWSRVGGTWTISSNRAVSTSADSYLHLNASSASRAVEVTVHRNGATSFDGGPIVDGNSGASDLLSADWTSNSNGSIELWKKVGGGWTLLSAVTGLYPGGIATAPSSVTVRIDAVSTSVVTVSLDGVVRITYTLTAGEQTTFKNGTHTYAGIISYNTNQLTFDNFHVDS